jgi:hypothetical protein
MHWAFTDCTISSPRDLIPATVLILLSPTFGIALHSSLYFTSLGLIFGILGTCKALDRGRDKRQNYCAPHRNNVIIKVGQEPLYARTSGLQGYVSALARGDYSHITNKSQAKDIVEIDT